MKPYILFIFLTFLGIAYCGIVPNPEHPAKLTARRHKFDPLLNQEENNKDYWIKKGKEFVENQVKLQENKIKAKNIIFFIGDGMSLTTLAASRVYQGGEEKPLSFENFPYTGLIKTYVLDKVVPDSASTSTAYLTGVKANYGTIGVNGHVQRKSCDQKLVKANSAYSIGKWALDSGKSIGLVTTTRVTHASPAGLYAHTADRDWENDAKVKKACKENFGKIEDIALQLIHGDVGANMTVVLGGGRREFRHKNISDEHEDLKNKRKDKRDLINEWQTKNETETRTFVSDRDGLLNLDLSKTDRLMGLFNSDHLHYKNRSWSMGTNIRRNDKTSYKIIKNKKW